MLQRILAFVLAGTALFVISSIAYLLKSSGSSGYLFLFFVLVVALLFGVIIKAPLFQSFKLLTTVCAVALMATSWSLSNAFYYNSTNYLYTIKDLHAPFDQAKQHLYVELDHRQVQLDISAAKLGADIFSGVYATMPMADTAGTPLDLFYMFECGGRSLDFDKHQRILYDFQNEYNYNKHIYFRVVNGKDTHIGTIYDGAVTLNAMRLRGENYGEVNNDVLVLAPIDFDPIEWRDFWRRALVITFTVFIFLLFLLIPRIIR